MFDGCAGLTILAIHGKRALRSGATRSRGVARRIVLTIPSAMDKLLRPFAALVGGDATAITILIEKGLRDRQRAAGKSAEEGW